MWVVSHQWLTKLQQCLTALFNGTELENTKKAHGLREQQGARLSITIKSKTDSIRKINAIYCLLVMIFPLFIKE